MRAIIAIAIVLSADVGILSAQERASSNRSAVVEAFHRRVDAYVSLHRRLEEPLPPMTREAGSWLMLLAKRYLASAIRTARARAQQGDIFSLEAAALFRELIAEALEGRDPDAFLREFYEPHPVTRVFHPAVNEPYTGMTHEVPPVILEHLPPLPEHVEYRIGGDDLLLWDADADIMVDFVPDAFGHLDDD
jgi:hypothetical protein